MIAMPSKTVEKGLAADEGSVIGTDELQNLIDVLGRRGYQVLGPTIRSGAIVYDEIESVGRLPAGWGDEQDGGTYRLKRREDSALFGYTVGPQSWKKYLNPPALRLWSATREDGTFKVENTPPEPVKRALLGVRSCELQAIEIQDKIFLGGSYVDPNYKVQREALFIVAVNCGHAGGTCFCASMGTGPEVRSGYDLALTEILEGDDHYFLVRAGSPEGLQVLDEIPHRQATLEDVAKAERIVEETTRQMRRSLNTEGIKELLYNSYEHPRWSEVAQRCLACGNCTTVCPTCFCTSVEDVTDLAGKQAERWRKWDSCFTADFSYIHGGSVRQSSKSRYRQWMTHKLASWEDQFGTLGCVGCGRCITWCPVGIDITEEARAIRETIDLGDTTKGDATR